MKHPVSVRRKSRSNEFSADAARSERRESEFVVCVSNADWPASLELRKIYRVISDNAASARRLVRVVDESDEDYLDPQDCFLPIELPPALGEALRMAS